MPTYNQYGWVHPNFSAMLDTTTPGEKVQQAKQRTRQYASSAPKKTLRKKPRTNRGSYQWDKGMTFEQKARMLANSGDVLGQHIFINL